MVVLQICISDTITGRTADAYQKEYRVSITGAFPVDIRVVRVTADSTSSNLVDSLLLGQVLVK